MADLEKQLKVQPGFSEAHHSRRCVLSMEGDLPSKLA